MILMEIRTSRKHGYVLLRSLVVLVVIPVLAVVELVRWLSG